MKVTSSLLFTIAFAVVEAEYCYITDDNPYRLYVEKAAYDDVRYQEQPENETPEGCEAINVYFVARHGSRHSEIRFQEDMATNLPPLRDTVLVSPNQLCDEDLEALSRWEPLYDESKDGVLAERGWEEFRNIANRFKVRVPEIFNKPYNESLFHLQYTYFTGIGDRTKDTAKAFAEGLWGSSDNVEMVLGTDPDWLLRFYSFCEKYLQTVRRVPVEEKIKFDQGPYMLEAKRRIERRLGLEPLSLDHGLATLIYESCRVDYVVEHGEAAWCAALTTEDLVVLEYSRDISYYWTTSYPYEITFAQACPLIADMVHNFQAAIREKGRLFTGLYAHTTTMHTLFTLLGLHYDPEPLTADNFEEMADRQWRVSLNGAMGANGAFILYRCDSSPTYRVKTFINEIPTIIPQCQDYECDLDDIMSMWGPIAENCDIEEICEWPEDN